MAKRSKSRFTDLVKFSPEDDSIDAKYSDSDDDFDIVESTDEDNNLEEDDFENYEEDNEDIEDFEDFEEIEETDEDIDQDNIENIENTTEIENENNAEEDNTNLKTGGSKTNMKRADISYMDDDNEIITKSKPIKSNMSYPNTNDLKESVILGNTTIKGDVITDTGIQIFGAVIGNIESGGKVQLVGKVEGDITGESVVITDTSLNGNITATKEVFVKKGCSVTGDIAANKVVLNGEVTGNIDAEGQVDFEAGSILEGNVSAKSFNIKPGARINGSIGTK